MMKKMNKKTVILCCAAAALLLSSIGIGVSLAYLGTSANKDNNITIGYNKTSIEESDWSEPSELAMTNNLDKTVTVKNNSDSVPCFVRVYAEFSDSSLGDLAKVKRSDSSGFESWAVFKSTLAATAATASNSWVFIPEDTTDTDKNHAELKGYFYYTSKIGPGDSTSPLFTDVQVNYSNDPANDSNIDKIRDLEMIVYSETVQTTETGYIVKNDASVYGYEYGYNEWLDAWKSYLKVTTT